MLPTEIKVSLVLVKFRLKTKRGFSHGPHNTTEVLKVGVKSHFCTSDSAVNEFLDYSSYFSSDGSWQLVSHSVVEVKKRGVICFTQHCSSGVNWRYISVLDFWAIYMPRASTTVLFTYREDPFSSGMEQPSLCPTSSRTGPTNNHVEGRQTLEYAS